MLVFEHAADQVAYGVLTGDALFSGDVGRPDLLASIGATADQLGKQLFHSIQHTLTGLPDAVRVFPAHVAGSACGKNLSTARQSTIGEQRLLNYACRPMAEARDFATGHLGGCVNVPADGRFAETVGMVPQPTDELIVIAAEGGPDEVAQRLARRSLPLPRTSPDQPGPLVLDVRNLGERDSGRIAGSMHTPLAEPARRVDEIPEHRPVVA